MVAGNSLERRVARLEVKSIAPAADRFFAVLVQPGEDTEAVIVRANLGAGPQDTVMAIRFVAPQDA